MPSYDLHLHSHYSYDALAPVEDIFVWARRRGLRCLSVTEHHVIDSLPEVLDAAKRYPEIRVVPGAEMTVACSIGSVDMLCYGIPTHTPDALKPVYAEYHEWQRANGEALVAGVQKLGFDYTQEIRAALLESYRPARALEIQGYTHVRNGVQREYFLKRGFIQQGEEYSQLLAEAAKLHPRPPCPAAERVLPPMKAAGALIAIAHPTSYLRDTRDRMDAVREELQFDGIECAHASVPPELTKLYREYCVEKGLFSTAGSDCHTVKDLQTVLGDHGGPEEWLGEFLARLG